MSSNKLIKEFGENYVQKWLKKRSELIIGRNIYKRFSEFDLVSYLNGKITVHEVRTITGYTNIIDAISLFKLFKLKRNTFNHYRDASILVHLVKIKCCYNKTKTEYSIVSHKRLPISAFY